MKTSSIHHIQNPRKLPQNKRNSNLELIKPEGRTRQLGWARLGDASTGLGDAAKCLGKAATAVGKTRAGFDCVGRPGGGPIGSINRLIDWWRGQLQIGLGLWRCNKCWWWSIEGAFGAAKMRLGRPGSIDGRLGSIEWNCWLQVWATDAEWLIGLGTGLVNGFSV